MQERYIATADLGSSKIAIGVARVVGDDTQVIYYRETPSDGIRYSCVFNPKRAATALKNAVETAENELKIKILQLVVGLPRYNVQEVQGTARIERTSPGACISREEISAVKSFAIEQYELQDEAKQEIYGAVAQSFSVDDFIQQAEEDVIGCTADSIEGYFKIYIGARKSISDIEAMLAEIDMACTRKMFLPHAVAQVVLKEEERDNGVALIELGAGVSSVSVYHGKILRHYASIPFGGISITGDIKYEGGFKDSLAENIKLAYGACMPEKLQSMSEKELHIMDEENGTCDKLPVKYLSEIITCRAAEIVNALLYHIQESGYADRLRNGVVITGGGAELANMALLIKDMSGYNVRIGYPRPGLISSEGCSGINQTSAVATVGMIATAKNDTHLNCTTEMEEKAEHPDNEKNGQEFSEETLFGPDEGIISPPRRNKSGQKKKCLFDGLKVTWKEKTKKAFDSTVGDLFDEMQ